MSDFFTRLAQRTLGLLPTVKPLIAPMFAQGLLWGRDRAFETLFRRSKTTHFPDQLEEIQGSPLRLTSLITSEQAFSGMSKVNHLFAEEQSILSQTYPNASHPASLSSVLPSSTSGEPLPISSTIQPSHSLFEQVSDQRSDRNSLDSSEWQPTTISESSSSNEFNSTGLEISSSQPTLGSEHRQLKPSSSSDSVRNLDPITQSNFQPEPNPTSAASSELLDLPFTNASHLSSIEPSIVQPSQIHSQFPANYNTLESITEATSPLFTREVPNPSEMRDTERSSQHPSEMRDTEHSSQLTGSSIDQPSQQTSQITPQLSAIEPPALTHLQSPAIQEREEQSNQSHSRSSDISTSQQQIQIAQSQLLPKTAITPPNQSVFPSSPDLPLVRSQLSRAQPPTPELWKESLSSDNPIELQNRLTSQELEADIEAVSDTPSRILSDGPALTKFRANSENAVRSVETAPLNNSRFYFRLGLTSSVVPVAVKPRLEPTELSLITADLPGSLSERTKEQQSDIRQSLGVEPTVQVTIGRVEVRSVTPPAPTPSQASPPQKESRLSLADYLKQREEGHS